VIEMASPSREWNISAAIARINEIISRAAHPTVTLLALRVALAVPFWQSGILKWDGFLRLKPVAILLFTSEFRLHLPGGPYPFPAPAAFAFAAGCAEIVLPILLVFGLATRMAATGLLIMTAVVQLTVPSGWPIHLTWAAMALALMAWGPGPLSIDAIADRYRRR
jgi:putative oxidoreductase